MEPFQTFTGTIAPMMRDNVDTDAIISAQAMVGGEVADPGRVLFTRWRYRADGAENPDFILNQARYRGARILVAGANFGCGSSREHAVWALFDYGIRCVVAPSFGEIFFDNCFQNGLLLATVTREDAERLAALVEAATAPSATVDLIAGAITAPNGERFPYTIDNVRREALLRGENDLDLLMAAASHRDAWRERDARVRFWMQLGSSGRPPASDEANSRGNLLA